ncbi:hypothetical protein ACTGZC_10700, partial [Streptococcus suis]
TDAILRIRIDRDGALPEDASWAVDAAVRKQRVRVTPTADGFATAALRVAFAPDGRMTITDPAGKIITTDAATPEGRGVGGEAFRSQKLCISNDYLNEPFSQAWREG